MTSDTDIPVLIGPRDIAARLGQPGLVVLDVRSAGYGGGRAAFDAAHIPGSRHTDYVADASCRSQNIWASSSGVSVSGRRTTW